MIKMMQGISVAYLVKEVHVNVAYHWFMRGPDVECPGRLTLNQNLADLTTAKYLTIL